MKRARTPTMIQMESIESGAAALGMILGYFGRYVTLEELRLACSISRDGSRAENIVEAATRYGLEASLKKVPLEELQKFQAPFLISWDLHQYLVVEGFSDKYLYVNDPAQGPRKISWSDASSHFSGTLIVAKPGPEFHQGGAGEHFLQMIFKRFEGCGAPLSYLFLASLFLLVPGIALPTFTQFFVDEILVKRLTSTAPAFLLGLLFIMALTAILTALQGYYLARLNGKLSIRLSSRFLWHILRLPIEFYAQRYGGEIGYRLQINDNVITTLTQDLAVAWINLLLIVAYGALIFFYDPLIAFIGIAAAIINLVVMFWLWRVRTDANIRLQQDMGKRVGMSIGGLQNIESLKAVAAESDFFARWAGYLSKTVHSMQQIGKLDIWLTVLPPFTQYVAAAVVLTVGGTRVIEGKMSLGMLLGLLTLMYIFLRPISRFVYLGQKIQNVKGGLYRIDDVLSYPVDQMLTDQQTVSRSIDKLKGEVELKAVTFGYSRLAAPLIENLYLHLKPGESIALVGPSGCGKTTIGRLITGLYHPWKGEILFDERPAEQIDRRIINGSLASVDQQIFLFEGSIRDNLTLWDGSLPEEQIIQGAVDATIHQEIIRREQAYDGPVLEGGPNFSGGQRQLLEIARVLAMNPSIIILDEATSSLDSDTEERILQKIKLRGCSSLIISHRLSTIRDCEEIIVLDEGKVIDRGKHAELKERCPLYQELMKSEEALT